MKKIMILIISIWMISSISLGYVKIYDLKSEKIPISSGVTYQNIKRFTTMGWLNINVLEADLTDEYVKIDMLTPKDGIYNLTTVQDQATDNNAVAAVNGEFFSWISGETGKGYPIGFGMKNGEIISTPFYKNSVQDTMATFSLNELKLPFYQYVKSEKIEVVNEDGKEVRIGEVNKISEDYLVPIIYNSYWNTTSLGNVKFNDMVEFVIQNDKVKDIREAEPPIEIPEDGYVICVRGSAADELKRSFNKGDDIELIVETKADMSAMMTAISGGAILVKDGSVVNGFTHDVSGYNPRTAVGTSQDNKTLYMITVDGRGVSKGVTQNEMAYLMNELGSSNAISFDGGGSTTMVGRLPGEDTITVLNTPSENRKVVDCIGVISDAPKSSLSNLIVEPSKDMLFVNHTISFKVKGYDKYINPIPIDESDITWKLSGVKGTVNNGIFKPTTSGTAKITATYKKISETIEVKVLGEVATIDLGNRVVEIEKGKTYKPNIKVKDINGYTADFDISNMKFTTSNNYCSVSGDGTITAKDIGQTLITAIVGNTKAFVGVVVTGSEKEVIDQFEKLNTEFLGYPSDLVSGNIARTSSIEHEGKYSLKLVYDFSKTTKTRGAYAKYKEPIQIDKTATKINLWAYTKKSNEDVMVKMQIEDATGETRLEVEFAIYLGPFVSSGFNKVGSGTNSIVLKV
jgi:exopolysaccharide biosynthesis protein